MNCESNTARISFVNPRDLKTTSYTNGMGICCVAVCRLSTDDRTTQTTHYVVGSGFQGYDAMRIPDDLNSQQQWCTEGGIGVFNTPHPKFRRPSKIVPNSTRLRKLLKIAEFRTPTNKDVRKKGNKILKLPPAHNCFTLAITNKLVVIINSLV